MKLVIQKLWTVMAMLWLSISASAYDFEVNGICYDITSFTDLTVTASSVSENMEGRIIVPSAVEFSGKTLSVTTIGDGFIDGNQFITSLLISDGIREIGSFAFNNCLNLSDVSIPESVVEIKNNAFAGCTKIRNVTALGAETIGEHCFEGCTSIENVTFSTLLNIPSYAFSGCSKLSFAEFPSAQSIGSSAFIGCAFSSFIVSSSVNEIKSYAFSNCKQLESFIIPNNVRSIETGVFNDCITLKEVTIGSGINSLPWIFGNCSNLEKLRIEDSNSTLTFEYCGTRNFSDGTTGHPINYTSSDYTPVASMFANTSLKEVYIGRNLTTEAFNYKSVYMSGSYEGRYYYYIPNPPFSNSNISKLEIGPLVTDFKMCQSKNGSWDGAFQNCTNLIETKILSKATTITQNSFAGCSGLRTIALPNTIKELESGVFMNCTSLETIDLGCYLTSIGDNAFFGNSVLSSINLRSPTPPTYSTGFSSSEYINTKVNIPTGSIDSYKSAEPWKIFWNLTESNDLFSLFEVDEIEYLVLSGNNVQIVGEALSSQQSLTITNSVTYADKEFRVVSIADNAFKNCTVIEGLEIEGGIATIGDNAFEGCRNLKTVLLSESVNTLGNCAFKNCSSLSACTLGEAIKYLPDECFYACISLQDITLDGIESIGNSCFYYCHSLVKIVLPPSIRTLGTDAFQACSNLKEFIIEDANYPIDLPTGSYDSATGIQKKEVNGKMIQFKIKFYNPLFNGLPIEKLYIGRNLSDSPRYTISGDGGVDYYIITSYDSPFSYLPKLRELIIGENVSTIGPAETFIEEVGLSVTPGSFKKCSSIKEVTVKNSIPPTGAEFSNTAYSNATLIVPDNTVSLFKVAEGWKEFNNILDETSAVIDDIEISNNCSILVSFGGITFEGDHTTTMLICGIDGKCHYSGKVSPGQLIALSKGLYIVTQNGQSIKVKI